MARITRGSDSKGELTRPSTTMSYSTRSTDERASHNKVNLGRVLSRLDKTVSAGVQNKTWWEVRKLSEVCPEPGLVSLSAADV